MSWDRRGDFAREVAEICGHFNIKIGQVDGVRHEFKWSKVKSQKLEFYKAIVEYFFVQPRIWFHCIIVRKADIDRTLHPGGYEEAKQKFFTLLLTNKIHRALEHERQRKFRIWVDPLPSRYAKAHEVMGIISNHVLNAEFGKLEPVDRVIVHESHDTPSIMLCDVLLGAVMAAWQQDVKAPGKSELQRWIATHLGWADLRADTRPSERKFNIWYFYDPKRDRQVRSRPVKLKYPI